MCVYSTIMERFKHHDTFHLQDARHWVRAAGYASTSASPAASDLSQLGFLRRLGDDQYQFLVARPESSWEAERRRLYHLRDKRRINHPTRELLHLRA